MFNQPGEILCQCFIVRSSRRRCPTAREGEGIVTTSVAASVYTLAHAVGFVTRSLYEARLPKPVEKEAPMAFRDEERPITNRMENTLAPVPSLIYVTRCYPEVTKYLALEFRMLRKVRIKYYARKAPD